MSDAPQPNIERPPRNLSSTVLGPRLFALDLARKARNRKTYFLLAIQLLPALIVGIAVLSQDLDGLSVFTSTVESVYIALLLPLTALFFGGPTIVDEVEGRTITYLTLRPLSRTTLFLSKLATSIVLALAVTILPILVLFGVCMLGSDAAMGDAFSMLASALGAIAAGAVTYTAIFALLGVVFSSTLLPGIVYFVVFEVIFGAIPVVEMLSVKFYIYTVGGYERFDPEDAGGMREMLAGMLMDKPLVFDWWVGLLATSFVTACAVGLAAMLFRNRQFHV